MSRRYSWRRRNSALFRTLVSFLIVLGWAPIKAAAEKVADYAGYNVIIVVWDSIRPDHLGAYGYDRNTSPFVDSLAKQGIVFDEAYSSSSFTGESVAALFTGRLPSRTGSIGWRALPEEGRPILAELFRDSGYRTGFLTTTLALNRPRVWRGFESAQNIGKHWSTSRTGMMLTEAALAFVDEDPGQKFMMYLHYLDPHAPYEPEERLHKQFAEEPHPKPLKVYQGLRRNLAKMQKQGFGPEDERFQDLTARYDAEIADVDRSLEALLNGLEERGLLDRTLLVFTGDHGEELLDHDFLEHAWTLYRESTHVPLLIWAKGMKPRRFSEPVAHVDLLPTLATLTGVPHSTEGLDGASLFVPDGKNFKYRERTDPIISELLIRHRSLLRSVTHNGWKYIAAQKWIPAEERAEAIRNRGNLIKAAKNSGFDPWGEVVHEELYQISEDPLEQNNVIKLHPERLAEMRKILDEYRESCQAEQKFDTQTPEPPLEPEHERALKALGYIE